MSAAIARSLTATFRTFGEAASYLSPANVTTAGLLVVVDRASEADDIGGSRFVGRMRRVIEVLAADLPAPAKEGRFVFPAETVVIVAEPVRKDKLGLIWQCQCRVTA